MFIFPSPFRKQHSSLCSCRMSSLPHTMASSSLAQMSEVQQGEENSVTETIRKKTASQYRKELAENKTVRGELTPEQRALRERKLDAYDASMKAAGKRVCLGNGQSS